MVFTVAKACESVITSVDAWVLQNYKENFGRDQLNLHLLFPGACRNHS